MVFPFAPSVDDDGRRAKLGLEERGSLGREILPPAVFSHSRNQRLNAMGTDRSERVRIIREHHSHCPCLCGERSSWVVRWLGPLVPDRTEMAIDGIGEAPDSS